MKKLQKGGVKSFLKNIFLKPEENLPPRMQTALTLEDRQAYMDSLEPLTQTSTSQIDLRPPSNIVAPSPIPISTAPKIQTNYSGNSIVDYLKKAGINDTSLQSRRELGRSLGINNIGTAEGNLALLAKLRGENYVAPTKTSQRTTAKPVTQRQIQKTSPRKDLNPYGFNEATGKSDYSNRNWNIPQNQTTSRSNSARIEKPIAASTYVKSIDPNIRIDETKANKSEPYKKLLNKMGNSGSYPPLMGQLARLTPQERQLLLTYKPDWKQVVKAYDLSRDMPVMLPASVGANALKTITNQAVPNTLKEIVRKATPNVSKSIKAIANQTQKTVNKNIANNISTPTKKRMAELVKSGNIGKRTQAALNEVAGEAIKLKKVPPKTISYSEGKKLAEIIKNLNRNDIGQGFSTAEKRALSNIKRKLTIAEKAYR